MDRSTQKSRYGLVASYYDFLGRIWTGGNIRKSKLWQLRFLKHGDRVLFAGVGTGEEVVQAAQIGVHVVIIDISNQMLCIARNKLIKAGIENVVIIHGDILDHYCPSAYDAVVANYLLDVFEPSTMQIVLIHLMRQVKQDGHFLVAGFAPASGSMVQKLLTKLHYGIPSLIFYLFLGNAMHKIYDYLPLLVQHGFMIHDRRYFFLFGKYIRSTYSICAVRRCFDDELIIP